MSDEIKYLVVDKDMRTISVPSGEDILGVYNDCNVEVKHFKMPRFYEGTDLADFTVYINFKPIGSYTDASFAENVEATETEITFNWVIPAKVFNAAGTVPFSVCCKRFDGTVREQEFNTTTYPGKVLAGIEPSGESVPDDPETIAQVQRYAVEISEMYQDFVGMDELKKRVQVLEAEMPLKVDDAYVEDGYLYLTSDGEIAAGPIGPFAGGGGEGGGNNAVMTVTNTTGWNSTTIAAGDDVTVSVSWSSMELGSPTGPGTLRVLSGSSVKLVKDVQQGSVSIPITSYLTNGANNIKVRITDVYGNVKTVNFSIQVVQLSISSSFNASQPISGDFLFPYTPVGSVSKTVYFEMDGTTIGTAEVTTSGRQQTFPIEAQTHGMHTLRVWFEAEINGQIVSSNELFYELICVEEGSTAPIITTDFHTSTVPQYTSLKIGYIVYSPSGLTTPVQILVNGDVVSEVTVDRTSQVFNYRVDEVGLYTIRIIAGTGTTTMLTLNVDVTESEIDVHAETDALSLYLTSTGRSNQEATKNVWEYESISAVLTGFNYTSDGWVQDSQGETVLRVSGDAQVYIPYKIFENDFRTTGKTIEIEFATHSVMNYDSTIISCLNGGRGLQITPQMAKLTSEQSSISTQFKEDEHVRIAFVVEKRTEHRLVYCYINGIMSGVIRYPDDDDFSQVTPANILIGSNQCTTDIYCIRIYDNDLTRYQLLDNWIADSQDIDDMLDRYGRNHIYDTYGQIVISQLPQDLPYMVLEAAELPQYKGDKKTVSGYFINPADETMNFTFTGAQFDVQGTSSQYYARKNYKAKFKNGFDMSSGTNSPTYKIREDSIPVDTFCFKADVASSEGANNVELVRLYCSACPYETPAQETEPRVRQGIDGFPMVVFWDNGETISFVGKYNFNNDKSTEDVFGFTTGDESWEILNNTSDRVIWKSDNYSGNAWLNDFEARYPDTDPAYVDPTNLKRFATWLKSTDTTTATDEALAQPVTYDEVTYSTDSAEYRLAKFRAEAGNYMEIDSALFYYLFTELFLMVDSRAKNAFPSFIGTEV